MTEEHRSLDGFLRLLQAQERQVQEQRHRSIRPWASRTGLQTCRAAARQPKELKGVKLLPFQLQTLQFMIDQESR